MPLTVLKVHSALEGAFFHDSLQVIHKVSRNLFEPLTNRVDRIKSRYETVGFINDQTNTPRDESIMPTKKDSVLKIIV